MQKQGMVRVAVCAVGLMASAAVAAAGCSSKFDSCITSRTCPDEQPAAGAGGGPEDPSIEAGGAKSAGGGAGEVATGSSENTPAHFAVVATMPTDAMADVERDEAIEVELSADVDENSVTSETFQVQGPSGEVDGQLSVDGARVIFTPHSRWALLADYSVTLGADLSSADAETLGEAETFTFRSRDGSLGAPQRLSSSRSLNLKTTDDRFGHAVVSWAEDAAIYSSYAIIFDPQKSKWGDVQPVAADGVHDYSHVQLCLNDAGDVFATAPATAYAWNRASGGIWDKHHVFEATAFFRSCVLANDGSALMVWSEGDDVVTATLSKSNVWSATTIVQADAVAWNVLPYGDAHLAFYKPTGAKQLFSRLLENGKWLPAKAVTLADDPAYRSYDSRDTTAIFTWDNAAGYVNAALFDGTSWTRKQLGSGAFGQSSTLGKTRHIAAWLNEGNAYAALYDVGVGWQDPVKLGASDAEEIGPGTTVDDLGSAFTAWTDGSRVGWRRFSQATSDWQPVEEIADQDPHVVFVTGNAATGDVQVIWSNDLGIWSSRFE